MRASDIMTRQVITIDADSTVADAAKLMLESHISGMPVIRFPYRGFGQSDLLKSAHEIG
jgi:CBS-domain-containing membrane protein